MRIVFMGTPEFAIPSLEALMRSDDEVVAVVCQPDKPKGRGLALSPPPTKILAEKGGIAVLQPAKVRTEEFHRELSALKPDVICTAAYGKILPKNILDIPPMGCLNVHASLLPKLRGAAPINWAIIRGQSATGITTMIMDEGMDTGDMLLSREIPINADDTGETLSEKLSSIGAELLIETIILLKSSRLTPAQQNHAEATYAPMLRKEDGAVDWSKSAVEIENLVRGAIPWPSAYTGLEGRMLKIFKAQVCEGSGSAGEVIKADRKTLRVATGAGVLALLEVQIEGGRRLGIEDFLRGKRVREGTVIGG
ncbi:MAG: methionyl-tRNA formyltransferase [Deltaproteobacteria bacterium]